MTRNALRFIFGKQLLIEIDKDRALGHVSVPNHRWFSLADTEQSRLEQGTRRVVNTETFLYPFYNVCISLVVAMMLQNNQNRFISVSLYFFKERTVYFRAKLNGNNLMWVVLKLSNSLPSKRLLNLAVFFPFE